MPGMKLEAEWARDSGTEQTPEAEWSTDSGTEQTAETPPVAGGGGDDDAALQARALADDQLTQAFTRAANTRLCPAQHAALAHVLALLDPTGSDLPIRPSNVDGAGTPALFREKRPQPTRRYKTGNAPLDVWKPHGGTSTRRLRLPDLLQPGPGVPRQEIIRRSGKIVRPNGLPSLRFRQYELGVVGAPKPKRPNDVVLFHVLSDAVGGAIGGIVTPRADQAERAALPHRFSSCSDGMSFAEQNGGALASTAWTLNESADSECSSSTTIGGHGAVDLDFDMPWEVGDDAICGGYDPHSDGDFELDTATPDSSSSSTAGSPEWDEVASVSSGWVQPRDAVDVSGSSSSRAMAAAAGETLARHQHQPSRETKPASATAASAKKRSIAEVDFGSEGGVLSAAVRRVGPALQHMAWTGASVVALGSASVSMYTWQEYHTADLDFGAGGYGVGGGGFFGRELLDREEVEVVETSVAEGGPNVGGGGGGTEVEAALQEAGGGASQLAAEMVWGAAAAVDAVVVAIHMGFEACHSSDFFVQFQYFVLAAISVAAVLDAVLDLRRLPPAVETFVAAAVRQFLVRCVVCIHAAKSVHGFGPYGWTAIPLLDLAVNLVSLMLALNLSSSAVLTKTEDSAARPPVIGVILSAWILYVNLANADEAATLLLTIAAVRIAWGLLHKWRGELLPEDTDPPGKGKTIAVAKGEKDRRVV